MPVVNVNLVIDDKLYAGVQSGVLELCGMVKNADSKRVVKHIPTVADAAKDGAIKAIDFVREHKKGMLIIGGFIIIGGAIVGSVSCIANKDKKDKEKEFANNLQIYLDAAKEGVLTIDILNNLINSLESISRGKDNESVDLKISASQFGDLIYSIYDYTKHLAKANNLNTTHINKPKRMGKKDFSDLQYYLNLQKTIFEQVA